MNYIIFTLEIVHSTSFNQKNLKNYLYFLDDSTPLFLLYCPKRKIFSDEESKSGFFLEEKAQDNY